MADKGKYTEPGPVTKAVGTVVDKVMAPVEKAVNTTKAAMAPINPDATAGIDAKQANVDEYTKANPPSYKRGGVVKKSGMAKVHKGERVLTKKQRSKVETVSLGKKGSFKVHPGALHRALGVPEGQKLGPSRIKSALHSKSPATRRMAASAEGLTHMHKG
jgi:hypothetical protein